MPFPDVSGITTIDQQNPYLQKYGDLTVSPELAAQLAQQQQNAAMMGQDSLSGVPTPQAGDNLLQFLANLSFAGQDQYAAQLADMSGIPTQDYADLVSQINGATTQKNTVGNVLQGIYEGGIKHNPLLGVAVGTSLAGALGAGGAGGAGGGTTAGATTYPLTAGPLATGGAITAAPVAGGVGGVGAVTGTGAGAGTISGSIPATVAGGIKNWFSNPSNWVPIAGNLASGIIGSNAMNNATDAESAAYDRAITEQGRQYDTTRADLMPWLDEGKSALTKLQDPNANFMASPDYGFRRSEGTRDIGNSFAARGGSMSGNALKALNEFNSNLASGEFGDWWNRQAGLAGVGQTTGMQLGTIGANKASNVGNYLANQGDVRGSGVLGRGAVWSGALNNGISNWLYNRPRP